MTDNMREVWDAHDKARNKAWREEPGTFDTLDAFKAGAAWQAAKSVPDAKLERLRKDAERIEFMSSHARQVVKNWEWVGSTGFRQAIDTQIRLNEKAADDQADAIDAAIQRAEANIAPDPYTGGAAPDPDMAHAAHCSDADCARCAAFDAAIASEGE